MPPSGWLPGGQPACYRHTDRHAAAGCAHCGRPGCLECLRDTPAGPYCVDCLQAASAIVPQQVTRAVAPTGTPVITYGLIAVNVAVFLLRAVSSRLVYQFALIPTFVAAGEWYRLLTSAFLHVGLLHLAFNMYALYVLGPPLERHLGRLRFTALYFLSALGGSVLVYLFSVPNVPTLGASGAIFGLFGATAVAYKRFDLDMRWLVGLIVVNLAITFTVPGISWQGHIGGLITGAVVAAAYIYAPRPKRNAVQAAATIGLLVVFGALIAMRTAALLG